MNNNYDEILKELNSNKDNIQFSPNLLDTLTIEERKEIEDKVVSQIYNGVKSCYKYIPYLKTINYDHQFTIFDFLDLPILDQIEINCYLYMATKEMKYLDRFIYAAFDDINYFGILIEIFNNENVSQNRNIILKKLLSIVKYIDDSKYFDLLLKKAKGLENIDIEEMLDEIEPTDYLPHGSSYETIPYDVIDENGNVASLDVSEEEEEERYKQYLEDKEAEDIIFGSIMGFAIGDAMGVPLEFSRRRSASELVRDMLGFGTFEVPAGSWSDDTSMTLATIDSIISSNAIDYDDIMKKFILWKNNGEYTPTGKAFGFGRTTRLALKNYQTKDISVVDCGLSDFQNNGNGSLMRMLPFALFFSYIDIPEEYKVQIINAASSMTHAHEISWLACKIYSDYIERLINNKGDKVEAYNYIRSIDYSKYYSPESIEAYRRILKEDITKLGIDEIRSSGYVVDTLEAVLWVVLTTNSFEEAIIKAINLGEDTDTIGAITGSIAGLIYKYPTFPKRWTTKLQNIDYLISLSLDYADLLNKNKKKAVNIKNDEPKKK